eukprot:CFRG4206T1
MSIMYGVQYYSTNKCTSEERMIAGRKSSLRKMHKMKPKYHRGFLFAIYYLAVCKLRAVPILNVSAKHIISIPIGLYGDRQFNKGVMKARKFSKGKGKHYLLGFLHGLTEPSSACQYISIVEEMYGLIGYAEGERVEDDIRNEIIVMLYEPAKLPKILTQTRDENRPLFISVTMLSNTSMDTCKN